MTGGHCKYCGQIEASPGSCPCPSLPAHEYWQRRGRRELPATVRFTAPPRVCQPESIDESFYRDRDRAFKIDDNYDPNTTYISGYPERSR